MTSLEKATSEENHQHFLTQIIESETVWYLSHPEGIANSISNEDDETPILLFWSDESYAEEARIEEFDEYEAASMELFDFLFRWLPAMSNDKVLAGTNWTQNLIGVEANPFKLREEIENAMPEEMKNRHEDKYIRLTQNQV